MLGVQHRAVGRGTSTCRCEISGQTAVRVASLQCRCLACLGGPFTLSPVSRGVLGREGSELSPSPPSTAEAGLLDSACSWPLFPAVTPFPLCSGLSPGKEAVWEEGGPDNNAMAPALPPLWHRPRAAGFQVWRLFLPEKGPGNSCADPSCRKGSLLSLETAQERQGHSTQPRTLQGPHGPCVPVTCWSSAEGVLSSSLALGAACAIISPTLPPTSAHWLPSLSSSPLPPPDQTRPGCCLCRG